MTKNSSGNEQVPDFIKNLEKSLGAAPMGGSESSVSFDHNSAEIAEDENLEKTDFQKLLITTQFEGKSLLQGALQIFRKELPAFLKVNLAITVSFLAILFLLLWQFGAKIHALSPAFFNKFPIMSDAGLKSVLPLAILFLFWIFFSYLRASYLAVISNYFTPDEHFKPLKFGLKKILSFILIECLQSIMFLIGAALMFVMMPFFGAKYFIALPAMINQDDSAINSMFESREYVRGQRWTTMRCMFFISSFTIAIVASLLFLTHFLIKDDLIFYSLNFFLFSFLFLPLHSCYRFLLYKKLEKITGELRFEISSGEKLWFVVSRLLFLTLLVINIFLIINGVFDSTFDKIIFFIHKTYARIF